MFFGAACGLPLKRRAHAINRLVQQAQGQQLFSRVEAGARDGGNAGLISAVLPVVEKIRS